MKCPHCNTGINLEIEYSNVWEFNEPEQEGMGYCVNCGHCPECEELIVLLEHGKYTLSSGGYTSIDLVHFQELIYPKYSVRHAEPEVPERYRKDFAEACSVLSLSPKASAALSRRILQDILRENFKIKHANLANEIDEFISLKDVPSYLSQAVDAIRNVGNFAAHPLKDTNTGEVVDVEPGEAEWLLDVLEALFDFAFVQPQRLAEKTKNLNEKLKALGKPPMKSKT
ncbi:DUF4145 domain-containing protein [Leptolyngbya sp. GGD]|uniref:DUF4145 domain-containing protein n=1 Tax=Leptolyngbya sp. GGD TaxID=2997907 RepID=UPI00227A73CE|nr:DUF4145 domain-containing protein [Leptolyngbya sp. GGD]MCY6492452.1 DUF4145 domain-containing protein [Leptolyngbya sp. GGD]